MQPIRIRIAPADPFEETGPAPTWQEMLYPGQYGENLAEQGELFGQDQFSGRRAPAPVDDDQTNLFGGQQP